MKFKMRLIISILIFVFINTINISTLFSQITLPPPTSYKYSNKKAFKSINLKSMVFAPSMPPSTKVWNYNSSDPSIDKIALFSNPGQMPCDGNAKLTGNVSAEVHIGENTYQHGKGTSSPIPNDFDIYILANFRRTNLNSPTTVLRTDTFRLTKVVDPSGIYGMRLQQKINLFTDDELNYNNGTNLEVDFAQLELLSIRVEVFDQAGTSVLSNFQSILDSIYFDLKYDINIQSSNDISLNSIYIPWEYSTETTPRAEVKYVDLSTMNQNDKIVWFNDALCEQIVSNYQVQILRLYNNNPSFKNSTYTHTNTLTLPKLETTIDWDKAVTFEVNGDYNQLRNYITTEGSGYYVWRVRAISNYYEGGIANSMNWGPWNGYARTPGATSPTILNYYTENHLDVLVDSPYLTDQYIAYFAIDDSRNWIHKRVFSEGKVNESQFHDVMAYYDNALIERQVQKRLPSDDMVVVKESAPDYLGRNTLQLLPIPVRGDTLNPNIQNSSIKFRTGMNPNYSHKNYDRALLIPDPLNANSKISEYYDLDNYLGYNIKVPGSKYERFDADIPDAGGYPFSRTILSNDGLNRPEEISLPGTDFNIRDLTNNSNHTIRHFYTKATEKELVSFFGIEAPDPLTVNKDLLIDQNNLVHISYKDMKDRVIMSATKKTSMTNTNLLNLAASDFFYLTGLSQKFDKTVYEGGVYKLNGSLSFPATQEIVSTIYHIDQLPEFNFVSSCIPAIGTEFTINSFQSNLKMQLYNSKSYLNTGTITNLLNPRMTRLGANYATNSTNSALTLNGPIDLIYQDPSLLPLNLSNNNTFASILDINKDASFAPLFTNINNRLQAIRTDLSRVIGTIKTLELDLFHNSLKKYLSATSSVNVDIKSASNSEIKDAMKSYFLVNADAARFTSSISDVSTTEATTLKYQYENSCLEETFDLEFCSNCEEKFGKHKYTDGAETLPDYSYDLVTNIIENKIIYQYINQIEDFTLCSLIDYSIPSSSPSLSLAQYIRELNTTVNTGTTTVKRQKHFDNAILLRFFSQYGLQFSKNNHLKDIDLYSSINYFYNKNFKYYDEHAVEERTAYDSETRCKAINKFIENFPSNILDPVLLNIDNKLMEIKNEITEKNKANPDKIEAAYNKAKEEYLTIGISDYFNNFDIWKPITYEFYTSICSRNINTVDIMLLDIPKSFIRSTPTFDISSQTWENGEVFIKNMSTMWYEIEVFRAQNKHYFRLYNIQSLIPKPKPNTFNNLLVEFRKDNFDYNSNIIAHPEPDYVFGTKEVPPSTLLTSCISVPTNVKWKEIYYDKLCSYEYALRNFTDFETNLKDAIKKFDDNKDLTPEEKDKYFPKKMRDEISSMTFGQTNTEVEANQNPDAIADFIKQQRMKYKVALMEFLFNNKYYVQGSTEFEQIYGKNTDTKFGIIPESHFENMLNVIIKDLQDRLSYLDASSTDKNKELFYALRNGMKLKFDKINLNRNSYNLSLPDINTNTNQCFSNKVFLGKNANVREDILELQYNIALMIHNIQESLSNGDAKHPNYVKTQLVQIFDDFFRDHPNYINLSSNNLDSRFHWCNQDIISTRYKSEYLSASSAYTIFGNYSSYYNFYSAYCSESLNQNLNYGYSYNRLLLHKESENRFHPLTLEPLLAIYKTDNSDAGHIPIDYKLHTEFGYIQSSDLQYGNSGSAPWTANSLEYSEENTRSRIFNLNSNNNQCRSSYLNSQIFEQPGYANNNIHLMLFLQYPKDYGSRYIRLFGDYVHRYDGSKLGAISLATIKILNNDDDCNAFPFDFTYSKNSSNIENNTFSHLEENCFVTYHFETEEELSNSKAESINCAMNRLNNLRRKLLDEYVQLESTIKTEAATQVNQYMKELPNRINQSITFSYNDTLANVTLYYYDKAGNLVKTVPPKGVNFDITRTRAVQPVHTMYTNYAYDNKHNVISSKSVDETAANVMIYNSKGQLRFSRSARDILPSPPSMSINFSYVCYDYQGRIIENGQLGAISPYTLNNDCAFSSLTNTLQTLAESSTFPSVSIFPVSIEVCTGSGSASLNFTRTFIIRTDYSDNPDIPGFYGPVPERHNLRNRVNNVIRDEDGDLTGTRDDQVISYYSYDIHGNVEFVIHSIPATFDGTVRLFARTDYVYDLLSHKVKEVKYNYYQSDSYTQKYSYDEDNKLTSVASSRYGQVMENDASYFYYPHGPLRRIEIGQDKIQGLDYTYTIQGWLKAINNTKVNDRFDPGSDGILYTTLNHDIKPWFPKDEFGMVFQYFTGDFNSRSNGEGDSRMGSGTTIGLYDGNIVNTSTLSPTGDNRFSSYNYRYDLLGRLIESKDTRASTTNNFTSRYSYDQNGNLKGLSRRHYNFSTQIDSLQYTWATDPSTSFVQNRVASVTDIAGATATINNDFEGTENYSYDGSGNLTNDGTRLIRWTADGKVKEIQFPVSSTLGDIQNIRYLYDASGNRVVKLVTKVNSPSNVNNRDRTIYARDANGQVMAIYENANQGPSNPTITPCIQLNIKFEIPTAACTWTATMCSGYTIVGDKVMIPGPILIHKDPIIGCDEARDLMFPIGTIISLSGSTVNTDYGPAFVSVKIQNGNPKATSSNITKFTISDPSIMPKLAEWHVYGNEQQGKFATRYPDKETYYLQDLDNDLKHRRFARHFDIKNYELKDHLGNVRTIVGDVKIPTITGLYPSSPYTADVKNRTEYYPYGWEIKLVGGVADNKRYGYNGKERDNDVKGEGNQLDFGAREYDPRIARLSSLDPFKELFASESPYLYAGDNPIIFIDLDGKKKQSSVSKNGFYNDAQDNNDNSYELFYKKQNHGGNFWRSNEGILVGTALVGVTALVAWEYSPAILSYMMTNPAVITLVVNAPKIINTIKNISDPNPMAHYGPDLISDLLGSVLKYGTNIVVKKAEELFVKEGYYVSYKAGTEVVEFVTTQETKFIRVFKGGGSSKPNGDWMMTKEQYDSFKDVNELANKVSIQVPDKVVEVVVPAGTRMRTGVAAEVNSSKLQTDGGGIQFELLDKIDESAYKNVQDIKK
jgi:RHS repeat-associated protein